ncbi:hypothetical protein T07_6818 [Trichinella nelsoni]|uniref:Uncharacterized protein n=1 Tax=Trichinella nelsoni TaxID=6336 RepID=A0A0V0S325_9BILA|nr:hypothetical protein T07_6818 [Trichinella nelsoni]KRZ92704.1 hypothetical protein T08_14640 [Trichinella sp. T8]
MKTDQLRKIASVRFVMKQTWLLSKIATTKDGLGKAASRHVVHRFINHTEL